MAPAVHHITHGQASPHVGPYFLHWSEYANKKQSLRRANAGMSSEAARFSTTLAHITLSRDIPDQEPSSAPLFPGREASRPDVDL